MLFACSACVVVAPSWMFLPASPRGERGHPGPFCQRSTAHFLPSLFWDLDQYLDRIRFYMRSAPFQVRSFIRIKLMEIMRIIIFNERIYVGLIIWRLLWESSAWFVHTKQLKSVVRHLMVFYWESGEAWKKSMHSISALQDQLEQPLSDVHRPEPFENVILGVWWFAM